MNGKLVAVNKSFPGLYYYYLSLNHMAKFEQDFPITGLSKKQFLVIAFETIKYLGWRIRFVSDAGVIAYTQNSEYAWNGEITVKLERDKANVQCVPISNMVSDAGQSEHTVSQYIAAFEKMKSAITEDEISEKYKVYKKDFVPPYEDTLKPNIRPKYSFSGGYLSLFKPAEGYFVTPILIDLNILIFLAMLFTGVSFFEPSAASMIRGGANATVATPNGQWWRLITNCFIHFGFFHLLMNMYALVFVGLFLEPFLGKAKFIIAYMLSGIIASLASLWWHDHTVSAGASGAIFGMYGVFLALLSTNHIERGMRKGLLINIGIFVVYNLAYGSFKGGIDNAAHIGGLVSGLIMGYAFMPSLRQPDNVKRQWLALLSVSIVAICLVTIACLNLRQSDRFIYENRIAEFNQIEDSALTALKDTDYKPDETLLEELQQGLIYWTKGISLAKELDHLKLSDRLHRRNRLLIQYCQLRIASYQLMEQNIKLGKGHVTPELKQINQQITSTIHQLPSR
ncbi:rhomboid family intramembrane serine protease [Mucilaginibacter pineti]|nr:rhomboid family intramembrane serine protease [Mucilaginibacter pineti]